MILEFDLPVFLLIKLFSCRGALLVHRSLYVIVFVPLTFLVINLIFL